jgi:hypothetical protein
MVLAAHSNAAILPPHKRMAGERGEKFKAEMDMAPPIKMVGNSWCSIDPSRAGMQDLFVVVAV